MVASLLLVNMAISPGVILQRTAAARDKALSLEDRQP
jgi:hypothetical protein